MKNWALPGWRCSDPAAVEHQHQFVLRAVRFAAGGGGVGSPLGRSFTCLLMIGEVELDALGDDRTQGSCRQAPRCFALTREA